MNVLFLCTGNSARSILGEVIFNELFSQHGKAYSAGSNPVGAVNPCALETLSEKGHSTQGLRSKGVDEFEDSAEIDLVISVCDNAANDCAVWQKNIKRLHWSLPDPAAITCAVDRKKAFENTYDEMLSRIMQLTKDTHAMPPRRGMMYVMSSPSGAGKTTITRALLEKNPDIRMSVSATTRSMRKGEEEGKSYFFVSQEEFNQMIKNGQMLEHASVFGNSYGTPRAPVEKALSEGKDIIFDIDWQGTQQLMEVARDDVVSVFILPPSTDALARRLKERAAKTHESAQDIKNRMAEASSEMSHYCEYDYVIINRDIDDAIKRAQAILDAEKIRRHRFAGLSEFVKSLRG